MLGLILLVVYTLIALIFALAYEVKLDWTENKELLLWYTYKDLYTGVKERKFIKILKL